MFVYHSIGEDASSNFWGNISEEEFHKHVKFFSENKEVVSLNNLKEESRNQRVVLTFDDGLRSYYDTALPILERYELPSTVFVCPFLSWEEESKFKIDHNIKKEGRILMSGREIEKISSLKNVEIGNHTLDHQNLRYVHEHKDLKKQIVESKSQIERTCGIRVKSFSFPYGGYNKRSLSMVKRSHDVSVGGGGVLVTDAESMHVLPRCHGHVSIDDIKYYMSYTSHVASKIENTFK
ncbi:polysaccharide deacetylase family protein [Salinibacter ruber]|uniref:polysaccharide deacetylase family protein n=1 Tax=Salinibacter ruber TaxID=146919 RepID=UPI0021670F52